MNKILLFAHLKEAVGEDVLYLDVKGKTVQQLKQIMSEKYVNLDNVMVAINEEFSLDDQIIEENDVIAFIPPVSGG